MNVHIGNIVAEITCMNTELKPGSTFEDFKAWLQSMFQAGFDREEYPNFMEYFKNPEKYWPFVQRQL